MISSFAHIVFYILFTYLLVTISYFLVISIAGRLRRGYNYASVDVKRRIAVFIPSYKEDHIIINTAAQAASHNYPSQFFDVFVIADKLQKSTIEAMRAIPVNVIEVEFDISMKSKSIHEALNKISGKGYEIAMVLDADNIMSPDCLEKVNHAFDRGYRVVQCHRVAKNKDNSVAILDIISEEVNNHFFRRGQRALGLPSSLIGSGMAFEYEILNEIFSLPKILDNPGEDKEIDLQLMKDDITVEFIDSAYVYDEKVSSAAVFEKQRLRWLEAQFHNFKRYFDKDIRVASGTRRYWYKFFLIILLPRSLYILIFLLTFFGFILQYFFHLHLIVPSFVCWASLFFVYMLALMLCIPSNLFNKQLLKSVIQLPVLIFAMVKALLRMKSKRKEFLHTPKVHTSDN